MVNDDQLFMVENRRCFLTITTQLISSLQHSFFKNPWFTNCRQFSVRIKSLFIVKRPQAPPKNGPMIKLIICTVEFAS